MGIGSVISGISTFCRRCRRDNSSSAIFFLVKGMPAELMGDLNVAPTCLRVIDSLPTSNGLI